MPFVTYPDEMPAADIGKQPFETPLARADDDLDPSASETVSAAFRTTNTVGSTIASNWVGGYFERDPNFDWNEAVKGYERFADRFEGVFSTREADAIKADIDREQRDRRILDASGWGGTLAEFGAAFIDLPSLVPGGAFVRGYQIGYRPARSALAVGAAAGGAATAAELALQTTQQTRTPEESAFAIGGSVILGGLLGYGGARLLNRGEWDRLSKSIELELSGEEGIDDVSGLAGQIVETLQSGGAAAVEKLNLEDLGISGKAADKVAKLTSALRINPGVQTMLSPSAKVRGIFAQLAESPVAKKMEERGESLGAAVETELKLIDRGMFGQAVRANQDIYRQARKAGHNMSRREFNEAVGRALRTGDVDPNGNEFVTQAARKWRSELFDKLKDEGINVGAWPEDVKPTTAASYLTRMYKYDAMVAREGEFRGIIGRWVRNELETMPKAELEKYDFVSQADMENYVDEVVESIYRNLTGRGEGDDVPSFIVPVKRGPLKERVLRISDDKIKDFLEDDVELVGRYYARTAGSEIALKRKFGRADMKDQIEEIKSDYSTLREKAKGNVAELKRLNEAERRDLTNIRAFRDMIRGTYNKGRDLTAFGKATRAALQWNFTRLLGGVLASSIPDTGRTIAFRGMRALLGEFVLPLATNLKAIKMSVAEAKKAGAVGEIALQARLATLAELTDPMSAASSNFERMMDNAVSIFSKATGLSFWNDFQKSAVSVLAQNRIIENAINWKGLDKVERTWTANSGIDEAMAKSIAAQAKKHGYRESGVWVANTDEWEDAAAQRAFRSALVKAADTQIVTKGVSDVPLFMHGNTGRVFMQFKSFAMASHQRVLLSGLQGRPRHIAELMAMSTIAGMMVSYLKLLEQGRMDEIDRLFKNPGRWIGEGLDRSGLFAIPFEVSNTLEKIGGVGIIGGLQRAMGDESLGGPISRYASRNVAGTVGGPTAGLLQDLVTIGQQFIKGDVKESGVNALFRAVPGQSLPGARSAVEYGLKPKVKEALVEE